jgi:Carboxypeptidase regulatory-like domain
MTRRRTAFAFLALLLSGATRAALAGPSAPPISGVVRHHQAPVAGVLVIAYNLGDSSLARVRTENDGTFVLASAPAGVYDLIAYKRGFEPAMQRLWHQADAEQVSAVSIALTKKGGDAPAPQAPVTMWELRDRLPTDILRELGIDAAPENARGDDPAAPLAPAAAAAAPSIPLSRLLAGEVQTMTDVSSASTGSAALSRAAVGLHGGLPNGWQYGISGDYATLGGEQDAGETTGNAAGLALDVAPSAAEKVRLSTRRNTLSFGDSPASLQSHAVSWSRGAEEGRVESVAARYIEEANLYRATALGTSLFPLASRTWEVNGRYARNATDTPGVSVAMTYRHREASVGPSGVGVDGAFFQAAPDADLAAATSVRITDRVQLEGGVVARYMGSGTSAYGIAPAATARYDFGPATLWVRGVYRVAGSTANPTVMPRIGSINDSLEPAATQSYAVGLSRRAGADSVVQLEVSQQRMGELVRAFFEGDFLTDFDSVYLLDGNSVRQYRASLERRLSDTLAGSVAVRYGSIDGEVSPQSSVFYGISGNRGYFYSARAAIEVLPTRTGVAFLVRSLRQDLQTQAAALANDSDKLALSVAQDLSIIGLTPFGADWKLLVAFEQARGTAVSEPKDENVTANRLLGGVAVAF